ncbi:hypothetical protein [Orenia metallireducens]|nr:hypothetical protein [Orenia metallireducens]
MDKGRIFSASTFLRGGVDFEKIKELAGWLTSVPAGIGPVVLAVLMCNVLYALKYSLNIDL